MKHVKHATGGERYLVLNIVVSTVSNPFALSWPGKERGLQTTAHKAVLQTLSY